MEFEIKSLRPEFRNYSLKLNIDPSDPTLDPKKAQGIFIHQNAAQFFDYVEKRLLKKILYDIDFIFLHDGAKAVSKGRHLHICGKFKPPVLDLDALFSENNINVLYHFLEKKPHISAEHLTRNILSSLKSQPSVVHPKYKREISLHTVSPEDLDLTEYARVNFWESPEGPYKLKCGKTLDLLGLLYKDLIYRHLQRTTVNPGIFIQKTK